MGTVLRVARWVLVVLLVLAVVAAAWGVWTVRRSFPTVDGTATVAALDADVTVHRDEWGVAHVYGDTLEDVARGQGYVHAQDRFWEMDVRRHTTAGRLSELFGEGQVGTDRFIRTLGWRRVAEAELPLLDDTTTRLLEAYAEGVNAYLADRSPAEVSLEYAVLGLTTDLPGIEPWEPADSVAWLKAMAWDLRSNVATEIERSLQSITMPPDRVEELYPAYPDRFDPILPGDGILSAAGVGAMADTDGTGLGSNSWAVAGSRTDTGGAILANDPHLGPALPSIWHQVGLHCREVTPDCPFEVSGFGFSGVPGVVIGRNADVAWGFTNLASDVSDLYVERVDGDRYEVDGEWRDMDVLTETIEVAGGDPVEVEIRSTRHGPLLSDASEQLRLLLDEADIPELGTLGQDGHAMALRWTALDPGRTADALYALNTAQDWDDFRAAAELFEVPAQNFLYADAEGRIGYQAPGRHPIRPDGHDGRWPVAGWTTDTDWQGFIPFDELPRSFDPEDGVIATANEPVVGADYAYDFPGSWAPGFRGERIEQLLDEALADGQATAEELGAIHMDNRILLADILVDDLLQVSLDGHAAEAQALLEGWDGQLDRDSAAGAYFGAVTRQVLLGTFADDFDEDVPVSDRGGLWLVLERLLQEPDADWWDDVDTAPQEDRDDILRTALVAADEELVERFGDDVDDWRWGAMHTLDLTHQTLGTSGIGPIEALFNRGPVETAGGGSVVNATGWSPEEGYGVTWVPSMRMVVDMSRPDDARWINLTGQSGHAFHGHYADMAPLWARGDTVPWHLTRPAVEEAAVATLTLEP